MFKKLLILIIAFYILVLVQISFLPRLTLSPYIPNLVLIVVSGLAFFEKKQDLLSLWAGLTTGFFLDIFSARPFGFYIAIVLLIMIFIKLILKKYIYL